MIGAGFIAFSAFFSFNAEAKGHALIVDIGPPPRIDFSSNISNKLIKKAESGSLSAETKLGAEYFNEAGLDQMNMLPRKDALVDMTLCRYWLTKAIDRGYASAEEMLGAIDLVGAPGNPVNCQQGLALIQKSAAQGYRPAQKVLKMPQIIDKCQ